MSVDPSRCDAILMKCRLCLAGAMATLAGCATPQQYVYNCNAFAVAVEGRPVAPMTFQPWSTRGALTVTHPGGSAHVPLRIQSNQVDSFGLNNAWMSAANVCRQFKTGVVAINLR